MPRESANRSSGSSGVTNASRSARCRSRLASSARCSSSRTAAPAPSSPAAQAANASMPSIVTASWRRSRPSTSGDSGRNQRRRAITATPRRRPRRRRRSAVAGMVIEPAERDVPHDRPVDMAPAAPPAADAEHRGGDDLRRGHRGAEQRGGEDHAGRRALARDAVERGDAVDPPPDRLHDAPAAERGARASAPARRRPSPRAGRQRVEPAVRDEQGGDDADRLLRVVGAVAEGQRRRHRPLARRAPDRASAGSPAGPPPQTADRQQRGRRRRAPARRRAPRAFRSRRPDAHPRCRPSGSPRSRRRRAPLRRGRRRARGRSSKAARAPMSRRSRSPRRAGRRRSPRRPVSPPAVTMPPIVSATALPTSERAEQVEDRRQQRRPAAAGRRASPRARDRVRGVVDPVGEREQDRERTARTGPARARRRSRLSHQRRYADYPRGGAEHIDGMVGALRAAVGRGTISSGQPALRSSRSVTEPSSTARSGPRPREPQTSRSSSSEAEAARRRGRRRGRRRSREPRRQLCQRALEPGFDDAALVLEIGRAVAKVVDGERRQRQRDADRPQGAAGAGREPMRHGERLDALGRRLEADADVEDRRLGPCREPCGRDHDRARSLAQKAPRGTAQGARERVTVRRAEDDERGLVERAASRSASAGAAPVTVTMSTEVSSSSARRCPSARASRALSSPSMPTMTGPDPTLGGLLMPVTLWRSGALLHPGGSRPAVSRDCGSLEARQHHRGERATPLGADGAHAPQLVRQHPAPVAAPVEREADVEPVLDATPGSGTARAGATRTSPPSPAARRRAPARAAASASRSRPCPGLPPRAPAGTSATRHAARICSASDSPPVEV